MMRLKTSTMKQSSSAVFVFWRTGLEKYGVLRVSFDIENEDIDVAAELVAIHHLLFVKQVFNRVPGLGSSYSLRVSRGALRKLALGKSDKIFAKRYAKFLGSGPMKGVEIQVEAAEIFNPADCPDIEEIRIQHDRYHTHDEVEVSHFGKLIITAHAVQRYAERSSDESMRFPRQSLVKRLRNPRLKQLVLDESVAQQKKKKYGIENQAEIWGHESEALKFVVLKDKKTGQNVLATVFSRSGEYW